MMGSEQQALVNRRGGRLQVGEQRALLRSQLLDRHPALHLVPLMGQ